MFILLPIERGGEANYMGEQAAEVYEKAEPPVFWFGQCDNSDFDVFRAVYLSGVQINMDTFPGIGPGMDSGVNLRRA